MSRSFFMRSSALLALVILAACGTETDHVAGASSDFTFAGRKFLTIYSDREGSDSYDTREDASFDRWKAVHMPPEEPVVSAFYRNTRDLGFWRLMTCTKRFTRTGVGGCLVSNYNQPNEPGLEIPEIATVAMSITGAGWAHFTAFNSRQSAFQGSGSLTAVLDHAGPRARPNVCVNCHGGHIDTIGVGYQRVVGDQDLGSVFREFEPSLLEKGPGTSQADAEQQWYELNQAIVAANAALRSEAEGARRGTDHAKQAIADHVAEIYAGLGEPKSHEAPPFSHAHDDVSNMPDSWRTADAASQKMWTDVVSGYCMGCHRINSLDFAKLRGFSFLRTKVDGSARLLAYLADDGRSVDIGTNVTPYMPQAELPYLELLHDDKAQQTISDWVR